MDPQIPRSLFSERHTGQPIIVLPGWYVESRVNYPIKAMNATYIVGCPKGAKRIFTPEQLEPVIQPLDERCRTLEF